MAHLVEYVVFAILMATNFGLGLYFSIRKKNSIVTLDEVFLGSRTLKTLPLAMSAFASMMSSGMIVVMPAYYYKHGFHMGYMFLGLVILIPVTTRIIIPVLYRLKVTSIFEYVRMRFGTKTSLATCLLYFVLMQSTGAVSIFASSVAISAVFHIPVMWSSLTIGVAGTIYTALGGLRGVVWTDCVQAVLGLLAPLTIIVKIIHDSKKGNVKIRPLRDFDMKPYLFETSFDLTKDENVWACVFGLSMVQIYRTGIDQMVVQRYQASKTLKDAQRTARVGTFMLSAFYFLDIFMSFALVYWYRDCDPLLSGAMSRPEQLVPFYVVHNLSGFLGFSGLFLAGVVSASTSTLSSIINSQTAILYVDMVSLIFTMNERRATKLTKILAFSIGALMTAYSIAIPYISTAARVMIMAYGSIAGPLVTLFALGLAFPWANSKGSGMATLLVIGLQLWNVMDKLSRGVEPPTMPTTVDYCPGNTSLLAGSKSLHYLQTT